MDLVIKEALEKLLNTLGIPFTAVKVSKESDKGFYCDIKTPNTSLLIGWHGETIMALQHILKCLLWKEGVESTEVQVVLDVDNYRKKQEENVLSMAERKAAMALESGHEVRLPPMNPYFRRKVHLFLAESEKFKDKITTESIGEGPQRQIRIIPK